MRSLLYPTLVATMLSPGHAGPLAPGGLSPAASPAVPIAAPRATVIEQARDGLFYLEARVNGVPVQFVVDSGASVVVLSARDAARAGVAPAARVAVDTAGGSAAMRRARIDMVTLSGGQKLSAVEAAVVDRGLEVSLLGQSALSQLASVTFRRSRLELE